MILVSTYYVKGSLLVVQWMDSVVKNPSANAGDKGSILGWEIPWSRKCQPTLVFLPGKTPWTEEPGLLQSVGSQKARLSD